MVGEGSTDVIFAGGKERGEEGRTSAQATSLERITKENLRAKNQEKKKINQMARDLGRNGV